MFFSSDYELQLRYLLPSATALKGETNEEARKEDQSITALEENNDDAVLRNNNNCNITGKPPGRC